MKRYNRNKDTGPTEYELSAGNKRQAGASIRAKRTRPTKCPKCDLHLCICQSILKDYGA